MTEPQQAQYQAQLEQINQQTAEIKQLADHFREAIPQLHQETYLEGIRKLQLEFRTQGIKTSVRTFSGEGARKFADWLKDMKKASTLVDKDDDRLRALALETLQGPAADFLQRKISANPNITWTEIRKIMTDQYSDLADAQLALRQLRKLRQKPDENVQNFSERLIVMTEDAFPGEDVKADHIQKQLTETFIDGVKDNGIARKLLRARPQNLDRAVEIATEEQQMANAFKLRREETPMEIDVIEQTIDRKIHALESKVDLALETMVAAIQTQQPQQAAKSMSYKKKYEFTKNGQPICNFCKRVGHIESKCRTKQARQNTQPKETQKQGN